MNSTGNELLDFDCKGYVGDQVIVENFTAGATEIRMSKIAIYGVEDDTKSPCTTEPGGNCLPASTDVSNDVIVDDQTVNLPNESYILPQVDLVAGEAHTWNA